MTDLKRAHPSADEGDRCGSFPELVRMNYFHGQMLSPRDFLAEQAYHRAKHLLINRCLHGYGVVCGLELSARPGEAPCADPQADQLARLDGEIDRTELKLERLQAQKRPDAKKLAALETELEELRRHSEEMTAAYAAGQPREQPAREAMMGGGFAIDPMGHEILVRSGTIVDLNALLGSDGLERLAHAREAVLWLSICYSECGLESVRPAALDECEVTPGCRDARIREGWSLKLDFEEPDADRRCETCCAGSCETCVLLARIVVGVGRGVRPEDVDGGVRRPFGLYAPTVITAVNWQHGGTYTPQAAQALLGSDEGSGALEIRFSRPIHVDTIRSGVVDILKYTGGRGESGTVNHIRGAYVDLPATGLVDRIRYRDDTGESLQRGDRLLIVVRCDFLLDACCRPVAGANPGRLPIIDGQGEARNETRPSCPTLPGRSGAPWVSGHGVPGGNFESWFYISRDREAKL